MSNNNELIFSEPNLISAIFKGGARIELGQVSFTNDALSDDPLGNSARQVWKAYPDAAGVMDIEPVPTRALNGPFPLEGTAFKYA